MQTGGHFSWIEVDGHQRFGAHLEMNEKSGRRDSSFYNPFSLDSIDFFEKNEPTDTAFVRFAILGGQKMRYSSFMKLSTRCRRMIYLKRTLQAK